MVSAINRRAAVHSGDYVRALQLTAEKCAEDLDNCEDVKERSTLARTLSTVLTALRLAETGHKASPAGTSGGGNGILAALQAEAAEQGRANSG